jgi:hypothetical protein
VEGFKNPLITSTNKKVVFSAELEIRFNIIGLNERKIEFYGKG